LKAGDIVKIGDREAKLIKPVSPSGFARGELWAVEFPDLPETVFRWIKEEA
jgi:hypothetical protein